MAVTKSLVFITCLCFARVFCDDYEEKGKDITLTPSIRGKPTEILWTHNENTVLDYDGREVVVSRSFTGRVLLDFETGQLTIRRLTSQDSGQYQSNIVINRKVQTSSHTVTVLDVLPEPQVTCEPDETLNVKKLLCSVESRTQLSYEWSGPNIKVRSGPELLVEEQEENPDSVYTCAVKNQANSKSTDFTLKDCHTGRAGTAVFVPVAIVAILIIFSLILLGIFLYRRKEKSRQSGLKKVDPENGEGRNLLRNDQKDVMPGSSEATLPCHARLPSQKQSIIDKKWDQDNGAESSGETDEGQKLLKKPKKLQEQNLKQSPQSSVSETNQEDTRNGNEGELDKHEKNSKHAVEAEENTSSKPEETEKERPKQRQEEEEKENSQKQESGNEEKFPEHQKEREEQKTEDNREDDQTPGEKEETEDRRDTETVSPQSAVTEGSHMETENEAEQRHKNEKSQSDEGEESVEQQNESVINQKTKDEDDMRPGEKEERSEEKKQDGMDRANTAEACDHPAVDQRSDGDALGSPAVTDSSANLEKKPMNSSDSSSNQTDQDQEEEEEEEERKLSGPELDEESNQTDRSHCTDQDQDQEEESKRPRLELEHGQEQMTEENKCDPETQSCKQTDSDSTINSVYQRPGHSEELSRRDEEVQTKDLKPSPQSAVSETNQEEESVGELDKHEKNSKHADEAEENPSSKPDETEKERPKQRQVEEEKEKSQKQESGNEEKFPEHQNEREEQKTEDNREDDQTPGEKEETEDRRDTVTDSPANLEKKPMNSSDSSSNQTDQEEEEESKRSGPELDEEETVVTNQEAMAEEENPEPEISEDSINSVCQRQLGDGLSKQDEEVANKSKMTDKGQSFKRIDDNTKVMQTEGETEVQTQAGDRGDSGQRHEQ